MRVLEVITGGEAGGAQRHLADLVRGLAAMGDQVLVAHGGGTWLDRAVPVPTAYIREIRRRPDPVQDLRAVARLSGLVDAFSPDVIHGHSSKGGFLARLVGRVRRRPVVFTAHGFVLWDSTRSAPSRMVFRWFEGWAARQSAAVIAVSARDRDLAMAMGARRSILIENAVTVPDLPWEAPEGDPPRVGFLGRFSREKGFDVLVSALTRPGTLVELRVAGDGPLADTYRREARAARIAHTFLGWQDSPENFLRTVNALAIPSWKEGLPYTLLDALALGVPTVVTDVGGMGDVVRELDPELVVPPGRPAELRAGIAHALQLPPDFTGRARTLAATRFTMDTMIYRTREVLREAARA